MYKEDKAGIAKQGKDFSPNPRYWYFEFFNAED